MVVSEQSAPGLLCLLRPGLEVFRIAAKLSSRRAARNASLQVVVAVLLAIAVGLAAPGVAVEFKPLGDGFFKLLRLMLAPVIFTTVVLGLAGVTDFQRIGRVGLKTLIYFEVVSTLALLLGVAMVNLARPGAGVHASHLAVSDALARLSDAAPHSSVVTMLLGIIPANFVDPFVRGDVLQLLFVSILVGAALAVSKAGAVTDAIRHIQGLLITMLGFIVRLAPIGAFGGLAASIGENGPASLVHLASLVALFYAAVLLFVVAILGAACLLSRLSLLEIVRLFEDELLIAFAIGSYEAVLARVLLRLEQVGVPADVAGFVFPAGFSFNQDGTALYMSLALGFVAQATDTPLSLAQQFGFLAIMLLTSKGSTGVPGGSLVKLAATLQSSQTVPMAGLGLLFGVQRPIGSAISVANLLGNIVATLVVARWEGVFDRHRFAAAVAARTPPPGGKLGVARGERT